MHTLFSTTIAELDTYYLQKFQFLNTYIALHFPAANYYTKFTHSYWFTLIYSLTHLFSAYFTYKNIQRQQKSALKSQE